MQALHISRAGFTIWPFEEAAMPLVVEIFPRRLTGAVVKSDPLARRRYVERFEIRPNSMNAPP